MWPIVKYYFGIYMGDLKETTNFLIQNNAVTEWYYIPVPIEYMSYSIILCYC
jgi:hypothetical protein